MLAQFSFGNYRSFGSPATLSLVATSVTSRGSRVDETNAFSPDQRLRLLKSAAVFGANASGKSNLVRALRFMTRFVLDSSKESQALESIAAEPFLLSEANSASVSYFEVVFFSRGVRFRYGFEVSAERVNSEWLSYLPKTREVRLFERHDADFKLSPRFREGKGIPEKTRANALFLSVVAQFNGEIAGQVLSWFRNVRFISGLNDEGILRFTARSIAQGKNKREITQLVQGLDLGIRDIQVETGPLTAEQLPSNMPEELKRLFLANPSEYQQISTVHSVYDDEGKPVSNRVFQLDEHESDGTKKLFALAGPLVDTLKNGHILVVDELDARLHTILSRAIVNLFHDVSSNPLNAQLVFTTQDTNLLDRHLFRRDQIWLTEKDLRESSRLTSLVEYRPRNDASLEDNYIRGAYGGIPLVDALGDALHETK